MSQLLYINYFQQYNIATEMKLFSEKDQTLIAIIISLNVIIYILLLLAPYCLLHAEQSYQYT